MDWIVYDKYIPNGIWEVVGIWQQQGATTCAQALSRCPTPFSALKFYIF